MSKPSVLVKICGVRTLEGAQAAVDAGADFLGFICYPPARRYIAPEQVAAILSSLKRRSAVRAVGVFVNQPVDEMNAVAALCGLDLVQLSGDEPAEMITLLGQPAIKAFRPTAGPLPNPDTIGLACRSAVGPASCSPDHPTIYRRATFTKPPARGLQPRGTTSSDPGGRSQPALAGVVNVARPFTGGWDVEIAAMPHIFALLLEPPGAGWGGAGEALDWGIARTITALPSRPPVFLAGGLRAENVAGAIAATRPDGVDVSSGVETNGVQDSGRIAAFVAAVKGVAL